MDPTLCIGPHEETSILVPPDNLLQRWRKCNWLFEARIFFCHWRSIAASQEGALGALVGFYSPPPLRTYICWHPIHLLLSHKKKHSWPWIKFPLSDKLFFETVAGQSCEVCIWMFSQLLCNWLCIWYWGLVTSRPDCFTFNLKSELSCFADRMNFLEAGSHRFLQA